MSRIRSTYDKCVAYSLVGLHQGKRPLGSPRRRWENNIVMDVRELKCEVDLIQLVEDINE